MEMKLIWLKRGCLPLFSKKLFIVKGQVGVKRKKCESGTAVRIA